MIESKNIFYIKYLYSIGGVETFIYEIAKKYKDYDITLIFQSGNINQIRRLKKYIRVRKYNGQKVKCGKAFFNSCTDIIDNVEAKEYIQIIHGLFKTQKNLKYEICPKITKYIGVSETACKEWKELTGFECEHFRNPLTLSKEDIQPVLYLISATRLTEEKGKDRMIKLAEELDKENIKYLWLIFTNDNEPIDNPNIIYIQPRLDIRPYILSVKGKGYGVQLSDSEGDCTFTKECEALGIPVICTPVPSFKEQGLIEGVNCYYMPFDMQNINVKRLLNIPTYKPYIKQDRWVEMLVPSKSRYIEETKDFSEDSEVQEQFNFNKFARM